MKRMISGWTWAICPAALLTAGAALRVAGVGVGALWYDEAYSLALTRFDPVTMVRWASTDFNPPLNEILIWPFVHLLGTNEIAARFPSLIASLITLWLAYRLIIQLVDKTGDFPARRVAAAALVAFVPVGLWTAQDARIYAVLGCLYLAMLYFALQSRWLGVTAVTGLILYCHNTGVFYAAAGLLAIVALPGTKIRDVARAGALGALAFVPWIPAYLSSTGGDFWLGPFTAGGWNAAITNAFFVGTVPPLLLGLGLVVLFLSVNLAAAFTFTPALTGAVVPLYERALLVAEFVGVGKFLRFSHQPNTAGGNGPAGEGARDDEPRRLLALGVLAAGPIMLMVITSATIKNIVFYRPLVPAVMPLCLWIAATLTPRRLTVTTWILPYSWAILLVAGLVCWTPTLKGGELRNVAQLVNVLQQPGDVVYHGTATSYLQSSFYLKTPGFVLDETQPDGLLRDSLQEAFGIQRQALEGLDFKRAWIFWARDPIQTQAAQSRMERYVDGAQHVATIHHWQAAPIEIYLKEHE